MQSHHLCQKIAQNMGQNCYAPLYRQYGIHLEQRGAPAEHQRINLMPVGSSRTSSWHRELPVGICLAHDEDKTLRSGLRCPACSCSKALDRSCRAISCPIRTTSACAKFIMRKHAVTALRQNHVLAMRPLAHRTAPTLRTLEGNLGESSLRCLKYAARQHTSTHKTCPQKSICRMCTPQHPPGGSSPSWLPSSNKYEFKHKERIQRPPTSYQSSTGSQP